MSLLRSSQNYIWNTSAVLGKGATGAVYAGLHKLTGESVAVKSFNHLSHMRPYEVQRREFEVLKKVNHENIVKLLAIEEENESQHKVLIMEMCTGGSLFNILDDPVNCYGLEEPEFLLVLKHLAAGMKHLRDNNIMHRDLKPGNIMKYIGEDGSSIYKLTDFGAARELEDDQQFMSLYGTEEYLHPDMYERAVLRKPAGKTFKANFDLWSIGVTLFHIATGSLPFKPYGGRKNKETMYKITTEKASGIICGIQHTENGEIEWSRNLPKTCLLSPAAQQLITELLAGLMECHTNKMWSFDRFFNKVTIILSHKVYHVFYVNHMNDVNLYITPNESINDFKIRLKNLLGIPVEAQLLLYKKKQLTDLREVTTCIDHPILLLNSDSATMEQSPIKSPSGCPKFPNLRITITNTDQDASLAKQASSTAYSVARSIAKCSLYYSIARDTPGQVIAFIECNVTRLLEKQQTCSHLINSLRNQLQYLTSTSSNLSVLRNNLINNREDKQMTQLANDSRNAFTNLNEYWTSLSRKITSMGDKVKELSEKWAREPLTNTDTAMSTAPTRCKHYCQKIKDSWQTLHKDKTNRILSVNEEQLHQLEKIKIENNCKKLNNLLINVAYKGLDEITEKLEDWYTNAQVAIVQSDCLFNTELTMFMKESEKVQGFINSMRQVENRLWNELIASASSSTSSTSTSTKVIASPVNALNENCASVRGETTIINCSSSAKTSASGLNKQNINQTHMQQQQQIQQQQQQQQIQQQQQQQPLHQQQMLNDVTSLFLSCTDTATLNSLPGHLAAEISKLREAHSKMWSALEENQAIISEFESLCVEGNHSS